MTFKLLSMSVVTGLLSLFIPFIIVVTFLIGLLPAVLSVITLIIKQSNHKNPRRPIFRPTSIS